MPYTVTILSPALKILDRLDGKTQKAIRSAVDKLTETPRPPACTKLTGQDRYRIRVGAYRVIYEVYDRRLLVLVVRIADRKNVYRER